MQDDDDKLFQDDDSTLQPQGSTAQDDSNQPQQASSTQQQDDFEKDVDALILDYNLDADQAEKLEKLENEGYDEEDALAQALDA